VPNVFKVAEFAVPAKTLRMRHLEEVLFGGRLAILQNGLGDRRLLQDTEWDTIASTEAHSILTYNENYSFASDEVVLVERLPIIKEGELRQRLDSGDCRLFVAATPTDTFLPETRPYQCKWVIHKLLGQGAFGTTTLLVQHNEHD